tara:strand:- start:353 stop:586 length:234 start_codon:yes stop_codon:yes gene_type:complete
MWKNIFLESCILSSLIFGGFYLNTSLLQDELYSDKKKYSSSHISGLAITYNPEKHISGQLSKKEIPAHISGMVTLEK